MPSSDSESEVSIEPCEDRETKKMRKTKWTEAEDQAMSRYIKAYSDIHKVKWSEVSTQLNNGKNGKQCRERWHTHLDPSIRKGKWDDSELTTLTEAHDELGSKWSEIVKRLPGRSPNDAKNTWHSAKRRSELFEYKQTSKIQKPNT